MLGTTGEAEDVVSDCWLRLVVADEREPVRDVEAWRTVATSRRALDVLRSARALLEPVMLNEVFSMPFPEVAAVVGRSPAAVRQLGVRARAHVAAGAPRVDDVEDLRPAGGQGRSVTGACWSPVVVVVADQLASNLRPSSDGVPGSAV
jgi:DNA-directed RNA polymerase specialized sigma24 family protein